MRMSVSIVRYNLPAGDAELIYEGPGLVSGTRILTADKVKQTRQTILLIDEGIVLQSIGEVKSEIRLYYGRPGTCTVRTPFGEMHMESRLLEWNMTEKKWSVTYELLSDGNVVSSQKIVWNLEIFS
jgi:uncharacterized beta-barrel protein YwiB (DUF1934 family)